MESQRESLSDKQARFLSDITKLLVWVEDTLPTYRLRFGDAYRDPRVFGEVGVFKGYGASKSCHKSRLAIDLILDKLDDYGSWQYQTSTDAYRPIGEHWEAMGEDHSWGGHFNDGNHFSFNHDGRR